MDAVTSAQAAEIAKYQKIYAAREEYRMARPRIVNFGEALADTKWRGSYLDIGCGRGEMLASARKMGFQSVIGVDVADEVIGEGVIKAVAWSLPFPDKSIEVVSMFDVIEHILPGDDESACREMSRVASKIILIAANNRSSMWDGIELHCNRRHYDEWDQLFKQWFSGARVTWLRDKVSSFTELWRIDLP